MKFKLSFIIGLFIPAIIIYYFYTQNCNLTRSSAAAYRIAIFEPASHPAMDEITQGFINTMTQNGTHSYSFKRYNANGNQTLLRGQAEEIIQQNYDLVMTIGTDTTKTMYELTMKKKSPMPIVFNAVSNPTNLGIIASRTSSGNNVTGLEEVPDFLDQLQQLLRVKPTTKNILLVYDPIIKAGIHEQWAHEVTTLASTLGITVYYAKVFTRHEIHAKVQPLLNNIDAVMTFTDHTTVSGMDSLITLCNQYGITLYASDLNSGDKGAALSYGVMQYDLGVEAAQLALLILEQHTKPTHIPIAQATKKRLKINTQTMNKQALPLTNEEIKNIQHNGNLIV